MKLECLPVARYPFEVSLNSPSVFLSVETEIHWVVCGLLRLRTVRLGYMRSGGCTWRQRPTSQVWEFVTLPLARLKYFKVRNSISSEFSQPTRNFVKICPPIFFLYTEPHRMGCSLLRLGYMLSGWCAMVSTSHFSRLSGFNDAVARLGRL